MSLGPQRGVALIVCWLLLFVYLYWYASRQLASHALAHERLRTMHDVQSACLVLCLSLCMRFGHLMRGLGPALLESGPDLGPPLAELHDDMMRPLLCWCGRLLLCWSPC